MNSTSYDPAFADIARTLTERGALDRDLARAFGVHVQTLYEWKLAHPAFAAATKLGKEQILRAAENALFRRATGYSFEGERIFCDKDGTVTRVATIEHVPPCDRAMTWWLKARRPQTWGAAPESETGSGETQEELIESFTRSRASLAAMWTDAPSSLSDGTIAPWILHPDAYLGPVVQEEAPTTEEQQDEAGEPEQAGPDPLADPRLWPAGADSTVQYPPTAHPEEPLSLAKWRLEGPPVSVLRDGASPGSAPPQDERVGCADQLKSGATPDEIHVPLPPAPGGSAYQPSFAKRARLLAAQGALDHDLACAFEVHPATIQRWKLGHPGFAAAVTRGKDDADDAVEQALVRKATGYSYTAERIFCHEGQVSRVPHEVHLPPSAAAARFLLAARGAGRWCEAPDAFALNRIHRDERDQRVWRADIAAHQAWQRGLRGRDLELHVLNLFGVAPGESVPAKHSARPAVLPCAIPLPAAERNSPSPAKETPIAAVPRGVQQRGDR